MAIIDFEFSQMNYRGADLALYLMETCIEYKKTYPGFVHHPDYFIGVDSEMSNEFLSEYLRTTKGVVKMDELEVLRNDVK